MIDDNKDTPPESPDSHLDMYENDIVELDEDDVEEVVLEEIEGVESDEESLDEDENHENYSHGPTIRLRKGPVPDTSDFHFKKHEGSVFCCNLDPKNGNIAVTGGEDEKAFVWEIDTGMILLECTGHKDSVIAAEFSHDGSHLVTADISGGIQVWRTSTNSLIWSENVGDITWVKWHHGTHVLMAALHNGNVYMWKIPSGEMKVLPGHDMASDCGIYMPDGRRAIIGYVDGCMKLFDLKTGSVLTKFEAGEIHDAAISGLAAHSDNNLILTGGGDGKVNLIKTQPSKVLAKFKCNKDSGDSDWVETVGFCKDATMSLASAGTIGGNLYIWDIAQQALRHKIFLHCGISRMLWDAHHPIIYTGCLGGVININDAKSGKILKELIGHSDNILDISLSSVGDQNRILLSAGDDNASRVFSIDVTELYKNL
uniref:Uncharacterized protein n=1 Tax=Clastoptera arizonana TaxID=38151 RepID=A0A1B6E5H3_9HEMI